MKKREFLEQWVEKTEALLKRLEGLSIWQTSKYKEVEKSLEEWLAAGLKEMREGIQQGWSARQVRSRQVEDQLRGMGVELVNQGAAVQQLIWEVKQVGQQGRVEWAERWELGLRGMIARLAANYQREAASSNATLRAKGKAKQEALREVELAFGSICAGGATE